MKEGLTQSTGKLIGSYNQQNSQAQQYETTTGIIILDNSIQYTQEQRNPSYSLGD
jgi:hypothetical protein